MAFVMVRVEVPAMSDDQLNQKVLNGSGDSTNPHDGMVLMRNLMDSILAGSIDAQVDVAVRDSTQSISASGNGSSASYNMK